MAIRTFQDSEIDRDIFSAYIFSRIKWEIYLYSQSSHSLAMNISLNNATRFIEGNFSQNISIDEIAASAGISVPSLYLVFRKHMNTSLHKYLLSRCMQEAKKRLAESNDVLKGISLSCGFANLETFCRVFKVYNGITPGNYRKQFRPKFFLIFK